MEFPDLKNFNPNSIKGFDPAAIKKLKSEDVREFLMARKFEFLAAIFVLITVFAGFYIFSNNMAQVKDLDNKIQALQAKQEPIEKYKKTLQEKEKAFQALPPSLNESSFITQITEIARKRHVRISSFSPPEVVKMPLSSKATVRISCLAPSFKEAIYFLNDIEKSKFAMRVESWAGKPGDSEQVQNFTDTESGNEADGLVGKGFMMDLVISSIEVFSSAKKN
ncbi:MAG: hypothetical protein HQL16_00465 [Candidatus Omnitrophica bacterium]|nr:hypothetical protein [Candidatus Omnitrophota bacterium]